MGPPVSGCIARVEPTQKHRKFIQQVRPSWVMTKLHHAKRLAEKHNFTADSWVGNETKVITTSTINDNRLDELSWSEERDAIRAFQPAYHIPTDVSVYQRQPLEERVACIKNHLTGVAFIQSELAELPTEVIPLLKGYTYSERELCLSAADALDVEMIALYATRYFTGDSGKSHNQLYRDFQRYAKHDMPPTLVIGLLAPDYLQEVPKYVVAASGQHQWRKRYSPDKQSIEDQQTAYQTLSTRVADALSVSSTDQDDAVSSPAPARSRIESNGD